MRLIDADALLKSIRMEKEAIGADLSVEAVEAWVELRAENAPDAVPLKPLAKWLSGRFVATGFLLPVNFHPELGSRVYATNTECWEQVLRKIDWEAWEADE